MRLLGRLLLVLCCGFGTALPEEETDSSQELAIRQKAPQIVRRATPIRRARPKTPRRESCAYPAPAPTSSFTRKVESWIARQRFCAPA